MRTYTTVLAAAALIASTSSLVSTVPAAAAERSLLQVPAASTGSCTFKKTEIAEAVSEDQSTLTTFVNLGDAGSITFKQAKTGCVAGTFFANAGNTSTGIDHVLLQVLLDGSVSCGPVGGGYRFANTGTDFSSHSAAFFCGADVAPGTHTIQVQYASESGGNVQIFQRTLNVSHR